VLCRKKEALDQRAGPVLKQCTEKGRSRKTGKPKAEMEEVGVWFDVVRKSRVVMLAGCEAASPKPDSQPHRITEQEKPTREKQPESRLYLSSQLLIP